jgi:hypothetical protein
MAEKQASEARSGTGDSAEKRVTRARQRAEHDVGILDNPEVPGEPSEIRHLLYFVAVVAIGLGLNLVAMIVVAGGR